MHFTSSMTRERHAFIDRTVGNLYDVLDKIDPATSAAPPDHVQATRYILDQLVVPNKRHGRLDTRHVHTDEYIPIYAVRPFETALVNPSIATLHPLQTRKITHDHLHKSDQRRRELILPRFFLPVLTNMTYKALTTDTGTLVTTSDDIISTRPLILLNMGSIFTKILLHTEPCVLDHEIKHTLDDLENPNPPSDPQGYKDWLLDHEIRAYRWQHIIQQEIKRQGRATHPSKYADYLMTDLPSVAETITTATNEMYGDGAQEVNRIARARAALGSIHFRKLNAVHFITNGSA